MGCWCLFSMGLGLDLKAPVVLKKVMLECANLFQPIVLVD
jgi:hypothetical protein